MATQTAQILRSDIGADSCVIEFDYDDTGIVVDAEGVPMVEDQPLLRIRIINTIPLTPGRILTMSLRAEKGPTSGVIVNTGVGIGTFVISPGPGINNVKDIGFFSLGVFR